MNLEDCYKDHPVHWPDLDEVVPGMVHRERSYYFEWNEEAGTVLARAYPQLPVWIGAGPDGVPYWFGTEENKPPYLWVSAEPPGILVVGTLTAEDWNSWNTIFMQLAR